MNRRAQSVIAVVAAAVLTLLAACNSPETPTPPTRTSPALTSPAPTPDATSAAVTSGSAVQKFDLGSGLAWSGPADSAVKPLSADQAPGECTTARGGLGKGETRIELILVGKDCAEDPGRALNGRHGSYLTPPEDARGIVNGQAVPAGTLVTFAHTYTECTNACTDFEDHVGLITLTKPQDPDFPVLMLLAAGNTDTTAADLLDAAQVITAG